MEDDIILIKDWITPATDYPENRVRSARIRRIKYRKGYYYNYGLRGYAYFEVKKSIDVTTLEIKNEVGKWKTWMVDDPPHWWAMQEYAINSCGNVLVAGLGLGLVTNELLRSVDVSSVTVIERNEDVIELISPFLHVDDEVTLDILNKDFYEYIHETDELFDRIIVDLWVTRSKEETYKVLHEEVIPLSLYLEKLFPCASLVFHGFKL